MRAWLQCIQLQVVVSEKSQLLINNFLFYFGMTGTMATAFSTDGSEVIQRSLEVNTVEKSSSENALLTSFEIPHCVDFIQKNSYQRVRANWLICFTVCPWSAIWVCGIAHLDLNIIWFYPYSYIQYFPEPFKKKPCSFNQSALGCRSNTWITWIGEPQPLRF